MKAKLCVLAAGSVRFRTTMRAALRLFVNVQVTVSPGPTSIFVTGLPSSQVALARSHPVGTVSARL